MKNKIMVGLVLVIFLCASLCTSLLGEYGSVSMIKRSEDATAPAMEDATEVEEVTAIKDVLVMSPAETNDLNPASIPCRRAVLIDAVSGRVLYGKNENEQVEMASTTKIMTAILALERGDLRDVVTVSQTAASTEGSDILLRAGEKLTLEELLYGLMLNSGNDAAVAIAEHIGGSVENFATMMTHRARQLGCHKTAFKTPHGLDREGHHTTALELAMLARHAMQYQKFNEIVGTRTASITGRSLYNTNELLAYYPGADGVKTGYTGLAGRCLVASSTQNGLRLISVALGADSRTGRAKSCSMLLDYGFENFKPYKVLDFNFSGADRSAISSTGNASSTTQVADRSATQTADRSVTQAGDPNKIQVAKGKADQVGTALVDLPNLMKGAKSNTLYIPIRNGEENQVRVEFQVPEHLRAPVLSNAEIGQVDVYVGKQLVGSRKIKTTESVDSKKYSDYFLDLCRGFVTIIS